MLTCWEALDRADPVVPDRLRTVDLHGGLLRAGFVDVRVSERVDWRDTEREMWRAAAALDPRHGHGGAPVLSSLELVIDRAQPSSVAALRLRVAMRYAARGIASPYCSRNAVTRAGSRSPA